VSTAPVTRDRPADAVAGLLAACALFASFVALAYKPARVAPVTIAVSLLAVAMGGRHARLAGYAVATATICFAVGMTIAVLTENPIF
jgi:hypothetical protein